MVLALFCSKALHSWRSLVFHPKEFPLLLLACPGAGGWPPSLLPRGHWCPAQAEHEVWCLVPRLVPCSEVWKSRGQREKWYKQQGGRKQMNTVVWVSCSHVKAADVITAGMDTGWADWLVKYRFYLVVILMTRETQLSCLPHSGWFI